MTKDKLEVMEILNPLNVPCGPILSMKELAEEPSLRATGTVVEVDHPTRGPYLTVGNPIKLSASPSEVALRGEWVPKLSPRSSGSQPAPTMPTSPRRPASKH